MKPSRPLIHVALAILKRDGKYLVTRRLSTADHLAGYWEFPGGKRGAAERWDACLRREAKEELGIDIAVGRRLSPIRFDYPERSVILQPLECAVRAGEPKPLQAQELRWVTLAQLRRLRLPPANAGLLSQLSSTSSLRRGKGRAKMRHKRRAAT